MTAAPAPAAIAAPYAPPASRCVIPGYDPAATAPPGHWFDEKAAAEVLLFFSHHLTHVKGEWAGRPFFLEPWQVAIIAHLFGWKRADGTRRYREAFIFVPRKNGKSLLAAGICNYMMFRDKEPGAEIYCAAAERDQAALVWDVARRQVQADPELSAAARIYQRSIVMESEGSSFKPISAEASTKHGYNVHCVVVDELHAQKTPELVDVLVTATGARRQPLIVYITTSDYERDSICNSKHRYACDVRDGVIADPSFLPVIYEATRDDDWTSPEVWRKANPNLGVSVSEDYLARECKRAQDSPRYQNTFKRLHLDIRTESDVRWFDIDRWDACSALADPLGLEGAPCFAGLDLASTSDLCAFALYFPDASAVLSFAWVPRETALERDRKGMMPSYTAWARDGWMRLTEGNVADYDVIRRDINALGGMYNIQEIAIDRWNSTQLQTQLAGDGFTVVPFGQGFASMTAPSKELEKLVLSRSFTHGGHPVLRWCANNVMTETDAAGNLKPSKKKSSEKIDLIVALVMALGRALVDAGDGLSVYATEEGRGRMLL